MAGREEMLWSKSWGWGTKIKLPTGAGAEITNYGPGFSSGTSIYHRLKEILLKKNHGG
jgi:hypothetical protein